MQPSDAKWYHIPATTNEPWPQSEAIFSGALAEADAKDLVRQINEANPNIGAEEHTGPNYGGYYQINMSSATAFKSTFADIELLPMPKTEASKPSIDSPIAPPALHPNAIALRAALQKFDLRKDAREGYVLTVKPDNAGEKEKLVVEMAALMVGTERSALSSQGRITVPVPDEALGVILERHLAQVQRRQ